MKITFYKMESGISEFKSLPCVLHSLERCSFFRKVSDEWLDFQVICWWVVALSPQNFLLKLWMSLSLQTLDLINWHSLTKTSGERIQ